MTTRNEMILKMYQWYGLKYGFFTGVFLGLLFSFFEPTIFGEIYKSLLISVAGFSVLFSGFGFIFYPLLQGTLLGGGGNPTNEEILDFMDSRYHFFAGSMDSSSGGSGSDGSGDGGGGGD